MASGKLFISRGSGGGWRAIWGERYVGSLGRMKARPLSAAVSQQETNRGVCVGYLDDDDGGDGGHFGVRPYPSVYLVPCLDMEGVGLETPDQADRHGAGSRDSGRPLRVVGPGRNGQDGTRRDPRGRAGTH